MDKTCIIHIGSEKTATTSFQSYFCKHRDAALTKGIWYPRTLGPNWHRWLAVFAMPPTHPDDEFVNLGIKSSEDHHAFCRKLQRSFSEEFSLTSGYSHCLISSEHFHSRLKSVEDVTRVR